MLNFVALLGWCALGITVLIAARYVVAIMTLRGLRFAPAAAGEHIAIDAIPPAEAAVLALAAPRLSALGFAVQHAWRSPYVLVSDPLVPQYASAWLHGQTGAWAAVTLCERPEYNALFTVSFYTFYEPLPHLYTVARRAHELIVVHPAMSMVDIDGDLEQQWHVHCERMQGRDEREVVRDADAIAALERRMPVETRAAASAAGLLEYGEDGTARLSWRGAWFYLRRYLRGVKTLRAKSLAAARANGLEAGDPHAAEMRAYADGVAMRSALAARRHDPGRRHKSLLLLATGVISLLAFGWQFGWQFSLVLVGVLLFHELGHLVVMRWAGYRDLQVFFVPLFGAVATGREAHVAAWKKMLVLLAGPLPGVILGCALVYALTAQALPPLAWLLTLSSTLLVINLFNLLPLVPLDGGRFFDLLFLARIPRLRGAFAALGALGMLGLGLWLKAPLVALIGAALMLGVPAQFHQAGLLSALRAVHHGGLDADGAWLRALTELFNAPRWAAIPYPQRLAVARSMSASSLAPPPAFATVVVGVLLYTLSLAMPVWVFTQQGVDLLATLGARFAEHQAAAAHRDFDAEISAASSATARASLLLTAADQAEDEEDYARAYGYYLRAAHELKDLPAALSMRVKAVLGVARNAEDRGAASTMLEDLLAKLTSGDRATRLQRADVQVALSEVYSPALQATILPRMSEVVATREALLAPADRDLIDARQVLAWHLWRAGRGQEAEIQLRERVRAILGPSCDQQCATDKAWLRTQAYLDLGWLLLATQQHDAAVQLLRDHAAQLPNSAAQQQAAGDGVAVLHGWVSQMAGDYAGASAALTTAMKNDQAPRSVFSEIQLLIDLAYFADKARDGAELVRRHQALRRRVGVLRANYPGLSDEWLRAAAAAPYSWSRMRFEAELEWLAKYDPILLAAPAHANERADLH